MKKLIVLSIVFFSCISFPQDTARYIPYTEVEQSMGIVYEASSFSFHNFSNSENPYNGMVKNIFLIYNIYLSDHFQLSVKAGYGWDNYNNNNSSISGKSENDEYTNGFPFECEIKFQHFTGKDSVFEPLIGIGFGYYNYKTEVTQSYPGYSDKHEHNTDGFAQYILFGMNFHLSKWLISSIQFKELMWNNISTTYNSTDMNYRNTYEYDYISKSGLNNISLSLGIYYCL